MQQELTRAQSELGKHDPSPYFMSYGVRDQTTAVVVGSQGSLMASNRPTIRLASVTVRVGGPALDNTNGDNRPSAINSGWIALNGDNGAIARELWELTFNEYRRASESYLNVKTTTQVNAKEGDTSADFSLEAPQVHTDYSEPPRIPDQPALEAMVRRYSSWFSRYPLVYRSGVVLMVEESRRTLVSTEGTRIVVPDSAVRLLIQAQTQADDGMDLMRVESFQAGTVEGLPAESAIAARVEKMAADLKALRAAPVAEPYAGPALLSGRAAAVFFHEVLGHRLEGHRQRGEREGQTFTKKLNQQVLPDFLTVADDPTASTLSGVELSGRYSYDDEGVPASRVELIQNGVLKNFLMSRLPIKGFEKSNGHGRAQANFMPAGRQGNLMVFSSRTVKDQDLRQKLIDEIKKQGKPYGLYFEDIQGGFTLTQGGLPQSFMVLPVLVWKVYPDGRPDQLVRGVDIVGTPLAALGRI
ncbi:MAG: peptidase U62, partial [Acidobacteria bacterium]